MNSLKHIKSQDDQGQQWQQREGSVIRLWNPESEDALLTEETGRGEFDITGFAQDLDLIWQSNYFSYQRQRRI